MKVITRTLFLALIILYFTSGTSAATFVVDITSDTQDAVPGDGVCADQKTSCSLRAAITEANALAGPDIITLGGIIYGQALGPREENLNAGGDWDISSDITINGVSQASTILQGTGCGGIADRVLDVGSQMTVTLNNLTIRHGCMQNVAPEPGGGIRNSGSLTLNNVTVTNNLVQNFEGGASGGGIFNVGSLTLNGSTVTVNRANAAMFGAANGGGIASFTLSPIVINNSSITANIADGFNQNGYGGGMYITHVVNLTVTNSHFDNNKVWGSGGGGNAGGGIYILSDSANPTSVNITGSTFNGNSGTGTNASGIGMILSTGVNPLATLAVTIDRTTVNGNTGTAAGVGAGIRAGTSRGSLSLDVRNSTISNNTGVNTGGGIYLTNTGGIAQSVISSNFYNSTLSGNTAIQGGGALSTQASSAAVTANFDHCTVANNSSVSNGGGLTNFAGTISITRTIVAGNTASGAPDLSGAITSGDYNHIGDAAGAAFLGTTTNNTIGPAGLGILQNNGGTTLTHKPQAGSIVVNSIPNGVGNCGSPSNSTDQRGLPRPNDGTACDKGSVERNSGPYDISGTVKTSGGMPIRNAVVVLEGGNLPQPIYYLTGNFGIYQFFDLTPGQYTVSISSKRFTFDPRELNLQQDEPQIDLVAAPEGRIGRILSVPGTK